MSFFFLFLTPFRQTSGGGGDYTGVEVCLSFFFFSFFDTFPTD